jgi:hypothetical protein
VGEPITFATPSFEISGATGSPTTPRWDRVDSRQLIRLARRVYFSYLSDTLSSPDPIGVVVDLEHQEGRVVFHTPVLLPEEDFVGLELIRARNARSRNRWKG